MLEQLELIWIVCLDDDEGGIEDVIDDDDDGKLKTLQFIWNIKLLIHYSLMLCLLTLNKKN